MNVTVTGHTNLVLLPILPLTTQITPFRFGAPHLRKLRPFLCKTTTSGR
jgi:hypothetical protein